MHRSLFFGALALAAAMLVACGNNKVTKTPQKQDLCEAPRKLNRLGTCVDCTSNADCPDGQQCDLLTGTCQPIPPPPPDAGHELTCQVGAVRCAPDGHAVQDCVGVDGGTSTWQDGQQCTGGETCNPQTLTCAICIPGETQCDSSDQSSTYQRCKNDGTGWDALDCNTAGTGFTCHQVVNHADGVDGGAPTAALATCRLCQPGTSEATTLADGGKGVLSCDSTGTSQSYQSCYPTNQFGTYPDGGLTSPPSCKLPVCYPGDHKCTGTANTAPGRLSCNSDGTAYVQDDCGAGLVCGPTATDRGACLSPCDVAENSTSYVGCDYWGVLLSNSGLDPAFTGGVTNQGVGNTASQFAFVVGNTSSSLTAHVTVTSNGAAVGSATVAPNSTGIIDLPWHEICGTGTGNLGYHLTSDVPVTVYQFNPLASALTVPKPNSSNTSCSQDSDCQSSNCFLNPNDPTCIHVCKSGKCTAYSYSNDASLLLPTHLLGNSYVVVAEDQETIDEGNGQIPIPGAMAVVATQDNTHVTVHFAGSALSTANSSACQSTQGNLAGANLGQTVVYTLAAGQVAHFWNGQTGNPVASGANGIAGSGNATAYLYADDFTGSVVTSDKPVAVFGGADCTFKPFTQFACDHIEEEMFPFSTWGKTYVGVKSKTYTGATSSYPDYWRIVAGCGPSSCPNGTTVKITPSIGASRAASSCGANCTCSTSGGATTCHLPPLAAGQTAPWIEFQHNSSFSAVSDNPLVLAQYFVSESAGGVDSFTGESSAQEGDPALVLAPPVEQWRTDYTVLAPTTYAENYLNLMVSGQASTSAVQVDGATVPASEWSQIVGTNYYAAVHRLSNSGNGSHTIATTGGVKVGVVVYGYDSYVSYGYTGGLDLQSITHINPGY